MIPLLPQHPPGCPSPLAFEIAHALQTEWSIGHGRVVFDGQEWDSAITSEIAATIDEVLLPRLAAHADKLEAAIKTDCSRLTHSLRSLIATLETVDSDERERARDEGRAAHVHTSTLTEARAILDDHGIES